MMKIQLKYFASLREALGHSSEAWQTQAATLGGLRDELIARNDVYAAALARTKALRMALNQVMAQESERLVDGAEVAIFPPVTGG